jgi:hypothetical protein
VAGRFATLILAPAVLLLAGCDEIADLMSGQQMTRNTECHTAVCDLFEAFEETHPKEFEQFLATYRLEQRKLENNNRAMKRALPYLEAVLSSKIRYAKDEDIREMLDITIARLEQKKVNQSPGTCVRVARDPAMSAAVDSEALQERHTRMGARLMRTAEIPGPVATEEEIADWIQVFAETYPENVEGLLLAERERLTPGQLTKVCAYAKAQWEYLRGQPDEKIGKLFRGLRQMAEKES